LCWSRCCCSWSSGVVFEPGTPSQSQGRCLEVGAVVLEAAAWPLRWVCQNLEVGAAVLRSGQLCLRQRRHSQGGSNTLRLRALAPRRQQHPQGEHNALRLGALGMRQRHCLQTGHVALMLKAPASRQQRHFEPHVAMFKARTTS
jgi:hypothetical protein